MGRNEFESICQAILPLKNASGTLLQSAADWERKCTRDEYGFLPRGGGGSHLIPRTWFSLGRALARSELKTTLKSAERKLHELTFTSKTPVPTFGKQVMANFFQQCVYCRERS